MLTPARMELDRMTAVYKDAIATTARLGEAWNAAVVTWFSEVAAQCLWERRRPDELRCATPPQAVANTFRQISPDGLDFSSTLAPGLILQVWLDAGKAEIGVLAEEDLRSDEEERGVTALSEFIQDLGLRVMSPDLVHRLNQAEIAVDRAAAALRIQQGLLEELRTLALAGHPETA